jgi:SAM-dependent methyltransferase
MISNQDSRKYDSNRYERISEYYNELMLNGYYNYEHLASELSSILRANGCKQVLELGIGTGLVASRLIHDVEYRLTGVDFSPSMIGLCDQKLKDSVDMHVMDVVDLNLGKRFDAAYCVGGAWYFIDNKGQRGEEARFQLCSHIPDPSKQFNSFKAVADHLVPGGILILSVQGPHHDFAEMLPSGLLYRQEIVAEGACFEKAYIFERNGELVAQQECLYRLTEFDEALRLFSQVGLTFSSFSKSMQFVVFEKAPATVM